MKQILVIFSLILITTMVIMAQEKRAMTIEDLWSMKRIGSFDLSPDGKNLAFTITEYDMEKNSGTTSIWLVNSEGSDLRKFRDAEKDLSEPIFSPDGRLSYLYNNQIWISELDRLQ